MAEKRSIEKQLSLTGTSNTLLLADSSTTSITYKLVTLLLIKVPCQTVSNQFFIKQMFVLKEKNIGEKFEFFDQDTQENGCNACIFCFV